MRRLSPNPHKTTKYVSEVSENYNFVQQWKLIHFGSNKRMRSCSITQAVSHGLLLSGAQRTRRYNGVRPAGMFGTLEEKARRIGGSDRKFLSLQEHSITNITTRSSVCFRSILPSDAGNDFWTVCRHLPWFPCSALFVEASRGAHDHLRPYAAISSISHIFHEKEDVLHTRNFA